MVFNSGDRKYILYLSFILILLINALHLWALDNHWYWIYSWFDILMHFLGGFWVGITFMWIYAVTFEPTTFEQKKFLWNFFGVTLLIIISWEVFELFVQNNINEPNFLSDTLSDMLLGIVGGSLAYRYFTFNFLYKNRIDEQA